MTDVLALDGNDFPHLQALLELGGIYEVSGPFGFPGGADDSRALMPGEREVTCPGCGQRFADVSSAAGDASAEENLEVHETGDEDCASVCGQVRFSA